MKQKEFKTRHKKQTKKVLNDLDREILYRIWVMQRNLANPFFNLTKFITYRKSKVGDFDKKTVEQNPLWKQYCGLYKEIQQTWR